MRFWKVIQFFNRGERVMKSYLCQQLKIDRAIVIDLVDEKPNNGAEFVPGKSKHNCSLTALKSAVEGNVVYFSLETKGCPGMKLGLGISEQANIPGGIEYFLSCGKGEGYPEGERIKKTPEIALKFYNGLPKGVIDTKYIVFRPIEGASNNTGKLVVFLVEPDQLSALIHLYSFESGEIDDTFAPMCSACASIVKIPLAEAKKERPRACIGLVDIWARPDFGKNTFAFTIPYEKYLQMEENAKDCFLQVKTWEGVKERLFQC